MPKQATKTSQQLEGVIEEAFRVKEMTTHEGWQILRKLIAFNIRIASKAWSYLDENSAEYRELKLSTLASYKLLDLVEDFESNLKKAQDLWARLNLPDEIIALDVDNLTPLMED